MVFKIEDNQNLSVTESKKSKKKKGRKAKETLVHFVLDETGSMNSVRDATIEGFNEYVNGLRQDSKHKYYLSLTKFDTTGIDLVYANTLVQDAPDLTRETYCPGSMTNLNDAIGVTITNMRKAVQLRNKKCNVLVVIMTDGHENASVEWRDPQKIRDLIKEVEGEGWTVTFLGANMDAQKVGQTYAIKSGNAKTYSVHNMGATMRGLSAQTTLYAATASVGATCDSFFAGSSDWTDDESKSVVITDSHTGVNDSFTVPVDTNALSGIVTDGRYNPPSKREVFDATLKNLEKKAKRSAVRKPLKQEGKSNG